MRQTNRSTMRAHGKSLRRSVAVMAGLISIFSSLIAAPAFAATASPNYYDAGVMCNFTMIFVRGSGEAAGVGSAHSGRTYQYGGTGTMLSSGLETAVLNDAEIPVYTEAINYPASVYDPQTLGYPGSENTGRTNLRAELDYLVSTCPNVDILLAGYSQGAQVIGDVLDGSAPNPLPASIRSHITAVALWGDPSYRAGQGWDAQSTTVAPANGIFVRNSGAFSGYLASVWPVTSPTPIVIPTVKSYCLTGDAFCQSQYPLGQTVHASYNTTAGWAWMRQFLIDED